MGGTRLVGARELLWSPAAIHGEAWGSEVTNVLTVSFRNGGWWCWSPVSSTSTAVSTPADGGSGVDGARRRGRAKEVVEPTDQRVGI